MPLPTIYRFAEPRRKTRVIFLSNPSLFSVGFAYTFFIIATSFLQK